MSEVQTRTGALDALEAVLSAAIDDEDSFFRNPEAGIDASETGVVTMTDGDAGEPEVILSPVRFGWEHQVELEITAKGEGRRDAVQALIAKIDAALAADRSLGGAVDDARIVSAPEFHEFSTGGAAAERSAVLHVQLVYTTASGAD